MGSALVALASAASVQAQTDGSSASAPSIKVQLFNIPEQPLETALRAYSLVTGNQLIYDSRYTDRRHSHAVVGLFTPETALRMLLDGTDLTIRYTGPQDITLVSVERKRSGDRQAVAELADPQGELTLDTLYVDVAPGAADRQDFVDYGRAVRLQVKRALAKSSLTANRIYHVQIDVWIDEQGHLQESELLQSSGTAELDAIIRRVVETIRMDKLPPKDIPLPIRITMIAI